MPLFPTIQDAALARNDIEVANIFSRDPSMAQAERAMIAYRLADTGDGKMYIHSDINRLRLLAHIKDRSARRLFANVIDDKCGLGAAHRSAKKLLKIANGICRRMQTTFLTFNQALAQCVNKESLKSAALANRHFCFFQQNAERYRINLSPMEVVDARRKVEIHKNFKNHQKPFLITLLEEFLSELKSDEDAALYETVERIITNISDAPTIRHALIIVGAEIDLIPVDSIAAKMILRNILVEQKSLFLDSMHAPLQVDVPRVLQP